MCCRMQSIVHIFWLFLGNHVISETFFGFRYILTHLILETKYRSFYEANNLNDLVIDAKVLERQVSLTCYLKTNLDQNRMCRSEFKCKILKFGQQQQAQNCHRFQSLSEKQISSTKSRNPLCTLKVSLFFLLYGLVP